MGGRLGKPNVGFLGLQSNCLRVDGYVGKPAELAVVPELHDAALAVSLFGNCDDCLTAWLVSVSV